jgi:glucokinase
MDLFIDCFGAEAGNMALRGFATAGVYVGGGISPKILPRLRDGRFVAAFEDKGRFRDFLKQIPVNVVLHEDTGLEGSAQYARLML